MSRDRALVPFLAGVLLLVGGCAFFGRLGVRFGSENVPDSTLRVRVVNFNASDARLHALGGGGRYLGYVRAGDTDTYDLSWKEREGIRFHVSFAEGGRCQTSLVDARPGSTVELVIDEPLVSSKPFCR